MTSFIEKEIQDAVSVIEDSKALGSDGFPSEFYQKFWDAIKGDLMQMFHDLHSGTLPLYTLSFGVITLIPKVQEKQLGSKSISQYSC
jgi:hypothetical protein